MIRSVVRKTDHKGRVSLARISLEPSETVEVWWIKKDKVEKKRVVIDKRKRVRLPVKGTVKIVEVEGMKILLAIQQEEEMRKMMEELVRFLPLVKSSSI